MVRLEQFFYLLTNLLCHEQIMFANFAYVT